MRKIMGKIIGLFTIKKIKVHVAELPPFPRFNLSDVKEMIVHVAELPPCLGLHLSDVKKKPAVKGMKKLILLALLAALPLLFAAQAALAAQASQAKAFQAISPSMTRIEMSPGETTKTVIKFMLASDGPKKISCVPMYVSFSPEGNIVLSGQDTLKLNSGVPFVRKPDPVKSEAKGEWESVSVTISVPPNTKPGDYPVGIKVNPLNLSSIIIIDVKGKNSLNGTIKNAKASIEKNRIVLKAEFQNQSVRTFMPYIGCIIAREISKEKKEIKGFTNAVLNISRPMYDFILPGNSREFSFTLQQPLPAAGDYLFGFYSMIPGEKPVAISPQQRLSVDRDMYYKHNSMFTLMAWITSESIIHLVPGSFFTTFMGISNTSDKTLKVTIVPADSWVHISEQIFELEAEKEKVVMIGIETRSDFNIGMLTSKLLIKPSQGEQIIIDVNVLPVPAAQ